MIAAIYARKSTEHVSRIVVSANDCEVDECIERDGASTSATLPAASGQVFEVYAWRDCHCPMRER
jgi:hypothetical protein